MKKFIIIFIMVILTCANAQAANTIKSDGEGITISNIDSDWKWTDNYSYNPSYRDKGIPVISIQFRPGAVGDKCVFKIRRAKGVKIVTLEAKNDDDDIIKYWFGVPLRLFMDYSEGTFSAGSEVMISIGTPF
jgi:hypothetical protein